MNSAIRQQLNQATSDNPEVREEAILQIAMLLERHSSLKDSPGFYQSIQRVELAHLELDATEQQEVVENLYTMVMSTKTNSSMIWALSKVKSPTALGYLVDLVCSHEDG